MFKSMIKFFVKSATLCALALAASCSGSPEREINKTEMDDFLTQFSSVNVVDFEPFKVDDITMIDFSVSRLWADSSSKFKQIGDDPELYISDNAVNRTAKRFFGKKISVHQTTNFYDYEDGKYKVMPADGAGWTFCQTDSTLKLNGDTAVFSVNVYDAPSTYDGDLHATPESWSSLPEDERPEFVKKMKATVVFSGNKYYLVGWQNID